MEINPQKEKNDTETQESGERELMGMPLGFSFVFDLSAMK